MTQTTPPDFASDGVDGPTDHPAASVDTLKQAMRRARSDDAERAGARAELRAARLGRLEMLQDALQSLLAQIPDDIDMFDIALVPSSEPRLFIDMIGFVEMGRDARLYVLQQDARHGRITVAESESLDTMVDAVTDYVARRLLERDKALASDAKARTGKWTATADTRTEAKVPASPRTTQVPSAVAPAVQTLPRAEPEPARRKGRTRPLRWATIAFAFLIDLLGAITFFLVIGAAIWFVWNRVHTPM